MFKLWTSLSRTRKILIRLWTTNKGNKITFDNFLFEIFNGLFSFDTNFWSTLIPLLTCPRKIRKDYKEGKRSKYSNPFRIYSITSIIFSFFLKFSNGFDKYLNLTSTTIKKELHIEEALYNKINKPDSIKKIIEKEFGKSLYFAMPNKKKLKLK